VDRETRLTPKDAEIINRAATILAPAQLRKLTEMLIENNNPYLNDPNLAKEIRSE
jgi:hypothetical protein